MKLYIENGADVNHILFKCVCLTICVSNFLLEYMMVYIQYDITSRCFLI